VRMVGYAPPASLPRIGDAIHKALRVCHAVVVHINRFVNGIPLLTEVSSPEMSCTGRASVIRHHVTPHAVHRKASVHSSWQPPMWICGGPTATLSPERCRRKPVTGTVPQLESLSPPLALSSLSLASSALVVLRRRHRATLGGRAPFSARCRSLARRRQRQGCELLWVRPCIAGRHVGSSDTTVVAVTRPQ
jgi:hypothetical protein